MSADLDARRVAAAAAAADFEREFDAYLGGAAQPDYVAVAFRLCTELRSVLGALEEGEIRFIAAASALAEGRSAGPGVTPPASAAHGDTAELTPADLQTVLGALSDATAVRESLGDDGQAVRYRALMRALGRD